MKIPKTIRIGNKEFKIKIKNRISWSKKISGQINYDDKELMINKKLKGRDLESTFFHELAHGLFHEMEFNYPQMVKFRNDETFIQEFGLNLRKTFLDLLEKQK